MAEHLKPLKFDMFFHAHSSVPAYPKRVKYTCLPCEFFYPQYIFKNINLFLVS